MKYKGEKFRSPTVGITNMENTMNMFKNDVYS